MNQPTTPQARKLASQQRQAAFCVHFRGTQHTRCDAGLIIPSAKPPGTASVCGHCIPDFNTGQIANPHPCPSYRVETPEERAAKDAEIDALVGRINTARKAITDHTGGARGKAGTIPCPVCKAPGRTLGFSVASCNGHIHAKCVTPGCVAWTE